MESLQVDFFNFEKPCPEQIPNCQGLRDEYISEIKKYSNENVCNSCMERTIRNKYITFILALTNK